MGRHSQHSGIGLESQNASPMLDPDELPPVLDKSSLRLCCGNPKMLGGDLLGPVAASWVKFEINVICDGVISQTVFS